MILVVKFVLLVEELKIPEIRRDRVPQVRVKTARQAVFGHGTFSPPGYSTLLRLGKFGRPPLSFRHAPYIRHQTRRRDVVRSLDHGVDLPCVRRLIKVLVGAERIEVRGGSVVDYPGVECPAGELPGLRGRARAASDKVLA